MNDVSGIFQIEVDGKVRNAEVLKNITLEDREYVIYVIGNDDGTNKILVSRIIRDNNESFRLVDLETIEEKNKLTEIVQSMF